MTPLLKQYSVEAAQSGLLKRGLPDEFDVTESVMNGIEQRFGERITPEEAVRRILTDVRQRGDIALFEWAERIEGRALESVQIPAEKLAAALDNLPAETRAALEAAIHRIRDFHQRQPSLSWIKSDHEGLLGQLIRPIQRVGVYVPGGTAPLPSTLLMSAVPAQVAGVQEIVVCTPQENPVILAAAALLGLEKVYLLGGAAAIGALAYGTDSVPRVDKIVGPGSLFVTIAKRQVYGMVGIDGLLGPTETLLIADESANPELAAADLLAQAEHDVLASAILLTPSQRLADEVGAALERQLATLDRADIIRESLAHRGGVVLVDDLPQAFALANAYAPEHLCLLVQNPSDWLGHVQNAGGVFLGEHSFEVLGDYIAGPSHAMPTGGSARFASPLNVWDFIKIISLVGLNAETAQALSPIAASLATSESLGAHAAAALARGEKS